MTGALVGVGMGPGDPELVTGRAVRALREADRVFAPTLAPDAVGRAESIVRQVDATIAVERLVFALERDEQARVAAHDAAADHVVARLDAGERVVFVTLGDPNLYSTFPHLAAAVRRRRPETVVETVPGIMAFQDLAARAGVVVADRTERMVLVSAADGTEPVEAALDDAEAAIVIYKGGRHLPVLAERLRATGRLGGAVFGELLGLPGERVAPVAAAAAGPGAYLSTVIVPPARRRA